jgi:hypothetical protein
LRACRDSNECLIGAIADRSDIDDSLDWLLGTVKEPTGSSSWLYSDGETAVNNDLRSVSFRTNAAQKKALLGATRKLGIVSAEYGPPVVARSKPLDERKHSRKENTVMVEPDHEAVTKPP